MDELRIASRSDLSLLQEACESLVTSNHKQLEDMYNAEERQVLILKNLRAHELISHLIELQKTHDDV